MRPACRPASGAARPPRRRCSGASGSRRAGRSRLRPRTGRRPGSSPRLRRTRPWRGPRAPASRARTAGRPRSPRACRARARGRRSDRRAPRLQHRLPRLVSVHVFDRDTAVRRTGDGTFEAEIEGQRWWVVRGPNGGFVAAIILRAIAEELGDPERPPRSLTVHYPSAPQPGTLEITVPRARIGRPVAY